MTEKEKRYGSVTMDHVQHGLVMGPDHRRSFKRFLRIYRKRWRSRGYLVGVVRWRKVVEYGKEAVWHFTVWRGFVPHAIRRGGKWARVRPHFEPEWRFF